jgi:hypothetical protein
MADFLCTSSLSFLADYVAPDHGDIAAEQSIGHDSDARRTGPSVRLSARCAVLTGIRGRIRPVRRIVLRAG